MSRLSFHELLIKSGAVGRGTILRGILSSLDLYVITSRSLTRTVISIVSFLFSRNEKCRKERATLQTDDESL